MEFASRPTSRWALAGLALLSAAACRRGRPPTPGDAAPPRRPVSAFALEGRVTDEADRAVPDARVLALGPAGDAGGPARHEARTDPGGRFHLADLPGGRYTLLIEAVGLASIEPPALTVPGPPAVVRLSGQGRSLSGSVESAGAPVAGARVLLGGAGGTLARETRSDDAGRFIFHGLGAGAYALRATKGLLASPLAVDVATDDGGAADGGRAPGPARLVLGAGQGIDGVVVDEAGRPLSGAELRAAPAALPDDALADATSTKPDGRFRVGPLPPGRVRLVARAPGYLSRATTNVTLAPGASVPAQRIELVRAASAEGRVADARGAPVAGALVRCGGGGATLTDLAVIFEPLPLAAEAAAMGGAGRALGATKVARTDARGAFRLDDLLPGPLLLAITRAPFAPLETETASLGPGEHRDLGVLVLADAPAPAPTPDAGIAAAAPTPARGAETIDGVARDSGQRPVARARVRALRLDAAGAPAPAAIATAVTDAGGHFALTGLPRGPILLELDHPTYPVTRQRAEAGARTAVELVAPIPGGVDGEVREHVTGAAVPRATVEALGPGAERVTVTAKKGAAFRLLRLAPGHWTLTARAPGYRATVRDVDVPASPILGETSVRDFRLELDADR
jgi:hypothetical protein